MDERSTLDAPARMLLERDALPHYLPRQRWFADKGSAIAGVRLADWVALPHASAELAIVDVALANPNGAASVARRYFVPFGRHTNAETDGASLERATIANDGHGALVDAFASDAFVRALVDDVRHERRRDGNAGAFVARTTPAFSAHLPDANVAVRRPSVEQSNTSVVAGEVVMLKGYRRVYAGPQPELEIARFLDAAGYRNTPTLYGSLEYVERDGASTALAILQAFVAAEGDGWATTLAFLDDALADPPRRPLDALDARMRRLGTRTAELHRAFASATADPAFAAEDVTAADLSAWTAQAAASAAGAFAALEGARADLPPREREAARDLLARRDDVESRLQLPPLAALRFVKTRFHGDFHLGQVLSVGDDYLLVDFEGEPGRPLPQRRAKSSPLRDVAGMLRSIDYAAVSGAAATETIAPHPADAARRSAAAHVWRRGAAAAYLAGYVEAAVDCPSVPRNGPWLRRLVDLFALEKACYELSYELANRPAWVRIPLAGIAAILDGAKDDDGDRTE